MLQYEYVTLVSGKWWGSRFTEHRRIIDEYAGKGWRYVGYLPTEINDYGKFKEVDLIFEKEA